MTLVATAEIRLPDPASLISPIAEHLGEHGAAVCCRPGEAVIALGSAEGVLRAAGHIMRMEARAPDLSALLSLRASLAAHLVEFAGALPHPLVWEGDGAKATEPGEFRLLTVEAVEQLTPRMRRITFRGTDLARFATDQHLHCKLLFPAVPHPDRQPRWPALASDGTIRWPDGEHKLLQRKYTIRRIDAPAGRLAIDFVLHEAPGPGSDWARAAAPGDTIGMIGPGGRGLLPGPWHLIAGDETALPAISRMLETLPFNAKGMALIEVADAREIKSLRHPPSFTLRWLTRSETVAGAHPLVDAIKSIRLPVPPHDICAWVGAEFNAAQQLRTHLLAKHRIARSSQLVVAYWRKGELEM